MAPPKQKPGRSKQDYSTPDTFMRAVKNKLCIPEFSVDFAADDSNAKADFWFNEQMDALSIDWDGYLYPDQWGWLNPPYADIRPWAQRCAEFARKIHIAFLVPASVGSNWFVNYVFNCKYARVLLLQGRLAFIPNQPQALYPKDCILVLYDPDMRVEPKFDVWNWKKDA